ncbi:hypothetical protein phiIBBPAA2_0045A [Pseudomonas phage phiIBB-PAA2]|uniref:Uncharacterized protein n=1 Tax=Pseudomonas phage phiIBB-PAA2 TaxID=1429758 RepID=V5R509_9CAUD|nr:hypothetical protein phiIBBPAA2_0045A [Pseudomonas phage phiIBB-PAA2]AHB30147.1 hypothetical protein phiIBBPAA2_0045A [Pseudomonas phage phiIBB-PAA2]
MTKAELEKALEEAQSALAKAEAKAFSFEELAEEAKRQIEFLEGMLDLVDLRASVFYGDWRGYAERSKG